MAAVNKRQPPPGYPTGGNAKEEAPNADNNNKAQQANGEDEDEADRGVSAGFLIGRPKPRPRERYPGSGFVPFEDYDPAPPRGPYNHAPRYNYPAPPGRTGPVFPPLPYEVSDDEDEGDYEHRYGHQAFPKPQEFYRRQAYVVDEPPPPPPPRRRPEPPPPPPPRRRPVFAPQENYYVRNEYARY